MIAKASHQTGRQSYDIDDVIYVKDIECLIDACLDMANPIDDILWNSLYEPMGVVLEEILDNKFQRKLYKQ